MKRLFSLLFSTFLCYLLICTIPLTASALTDTESNDTAGTAQRITSGVSINGSITQKDVDFYQINLSSDGQINFDMTSYMQYYTLQILDSTGEELWYTDNNSWNSTVGFRNDKYHINLTSGIYYIKATGYQYRNYVNYWSPAYSTGTYILVYNFTSANSTEREPNNSIANADTLSANTTLTGQIAVNDSWDMHKITISESGRVNLDITSYMRYYTLHIFDTSGTELWYSDYNEWNDTVGFRNDIYNIDLTQGTYYVKVTGYKYNSYQGSTGTYKLKYTFTAAHATETENNNSIADANTISSGDIKGQIAINDRYDFYKITVPSSNALKLEIVSYMQYYSLYLYDANGNQVWYDEYNEWTSTIGYREDSFALSFPSGTYYLKVTGYKYSTYQASTGTYSLSVNKTGCSHSYGNWAETKAPTCTASGTERRDCTKCDYYETRKIAALGHTEKTIPSVNATCTTAGLTTGKKCSVCGTITVEQKTVPPLGHTYTDESDTVCDRCGASNEATDSGTCGDNLIWNYDSEAKELHIYGTGDMDLFLSYDLSVTVPWYHLRNEIQSVNIDNGVTNIGQYAFSDCTALIEIDIPETVTKIAGRAFRNCNSLQTINLPSQIVEIPDNLFYNCYSLKKLAIPENVVEIDAYAFRFCSNLEVTFLGNAPEIDLFAFSEGSATIRYPANDDTWADLVDIDFRGDVVFVPYSDLEAPDISIANRASDGKPKLTWAQVDGAVKYEVYRSKTGKDGSFSRISRVTGTSLTNTSAEAGTKYYYKVKAVDANGNKSDFSNRVSRVCDLARPVVKTSNVASSGKIKLTWAKIDGAKSYKVYRATSQNGKYTLMKTTTSTTYTNTSAKAGTKYYYKVIAVHENSNANSAYSSVVSRMCDLARPTVSIKRNSAGKPRISWEKVEGAVKYEVYRSTSKNGTYKRIATTKNLYQVNKNAVAGKTYYYKVKAIHSNTNANSAFSLPKYIKAK